MQEGIEMKKVLIVCDPFPPQFAPRMGYLVKYLGQFGWETHVVAADDNSGRSNMGELTGYAKEVHIIPQKPHRKWNLLHLLALFWPFDYLRGEYDLRRKALEIARSNKFEVVLSSISFNVFPSYTAVMTLSPALSMVTFKTAIPFSMFPVKLTPFTVTVTFPFTSDAFALTVTVVGVPAIPSSASTLILVEYLLTWNVVELVLL